MYGAYRLATFGSRYYRPIGEPPKEADDGVHNNVNETIDASVFDRWRNVPEYRPSNLVDWAKRYDANVATLDKSVRADAPQAAAPD